MQAVADIFRNIQVLQQFHAVLLNSFEAKCGGGVASITYDTMLGEVFDTLGQYMRVYADYCIGQVVCAIAL